MVDILVAKVGPSAILEIIAATVVQNVAPETLPIRSINRSAPAT